MLVPIHFRVEVEGCLQGFTVQGLGCGEWDVWCGRSAGRVSGVVKGGQFQVSGVQTDSVQARRSRNTLHGLGSNSTLSHSLGERRLPVSPPPPLQILIRTAANFLTPAEQGVAAPLRRPDPLPSVLGWLASTAGAIPDLR